MVHTTNSPAVECGSRERAKERQRKSDDGRSGGEKRRERAGSDCKVITVMPYRPVEYIREAVQEMSLPLCCRSAERGICS